MNTVICGFHYSEIARFKKHCRNQLLYFTMHSDENATLRVDSEFLAKLFLIDADNIDGELYTAEDHAAADPILNEYLNGENNVRELSMEDVRMFLDFAMHRRLTAEQNEPLAMKLAEEYNRIQSNELLRISDMEAFRKLCRSIDNAEE
ncbi:MAG: hypothetical protein IJD13_09465 [Oscillospiraceae bacterium]|nr:hypothetical protein [Oscillospiraceae bacterium]